MERWLDSGMKAAHVRERNAPAGAPWRPVAVPDAGDAPRCWLDLEVAPRRAPWLPAPGLAHDRVLFRRAVTTLDDLLARGSASSRCATSSRASPPR